MPTCIDCHGVHNIQDPTTAQFRNETPQLCAKCHANDTLMRLRTLYEYLEHLCIRFSRNHRHTL
ncbi:MAG: hypothetical protein IPJ46_02160 [Anaerolineales bacterium]|nr:hypothetical protein [Anaerolineales bacterium]